MAVVTVAVLAGPSSAQATPLTITEFWASANPSAPGDPQTSDAASHPDSTVHMHFGGTDDVKDIIQHYPPGIIPNPEAIPKCPQDDFFDLKTCPANSKLGTSTLTATSDTLPLLPPVTLEGSVYNLDVSPPWAGGLGFIVAGNTTPRPPSAGGS